MRPLQAVGLGLLWIILATPDEAVDWFPDPVGWVLVLAGLWVLRRGDALAAYRTGLWALAALGLAVSAAVWPPGPSDWLADAPPGVGWAADLARFGFFTLLCHALVAAARASEDPRRTAAAGWYRTAEIALLAVMVAPVLVFGAGFTWLEGLSGLVAQMCLLLLLVLCFIHASREWAGGPADPTGDSSHTRT